MERSITHNGRTGFGSLTPGGLNLDNFPMKLFTKGNGKVWNPADINFTQDAVDFAAMSPDEQRLTMVLAAHFIGGEESVTQDLQPFAAAMAAQGRLGDELYLTQFIYEEAKHTEGFRRFFNAIGHENTDLHQYVEYSDSYKQIFLDELPSALYALADDPSPVNQVRASVTYNHVVEGCLALTGYFAWAKMCQRRGILPGMQQLIKHIGDDERRHMAWGTFTCRRLIAADDGNWGAISDRMQELLNPALSLIVSLFSEYEDREIPFGITIDEMTDYALDKVNRRLESMESARGADPASIDLDYSPADLEERFHIEDQKVIADSIAQDENLVGS
ncbi:ribonucleotide-diphosphate reductase subunit beta (plasmid) [Rhodococcus oxybenzonivorans]|jgi:ribonucleoside-diphosphate reductase beta chain|uniref:R2-like ligand binding oxidase n=1 Tax=Rhodococcus oxybenzonivorans TaxID=1990687 RepID=A0A2S2C868_9NOCA|nr:MULTISPECIES: R2-like ligand-binding oxidase [Rhodococcus]AWK77003.1 ribonucleotide-diphosphate reductase subunit beta [Rhodococcus oxybenzonivorans]QTJ71316.1 R2-like ligand-binding oxidase [Rhodococcus sp. ZPP]